MREKESVFKTPKVPRTKKHQPADDVSNKCSDKNKALDRHVLYPRELSSFRMIPCAENHNNRNYQLYLGWDGWYQIRCDCATQGLIGLTPFRKMFFKNTAIDYNVDFTPHKTVKKSKIAECDPTIVAQKCVPHRKDNKKQAKFVPNDIFESCTKKHDTKLVCLIDVERGNTLIVCQCKDKLNDVRYFPFSYSSLNGFDKRYVYKYYKPEYRGFKAKPAKGWAKRL